MYVEAFPARRVQRRAVRREIKREKEKERKKKRHNEERKKDNEDDRLNEGQRTKGRQKRRVPMQLRGFGALNVYASMWHASSRDESQAWSLYYSHAAAFRGCVRCIRISRFRKKRTVDF